MCDEDDEDDEDGVDGLDGDGGNKTGIRRGMVVSSSFPAPDNGITFLLNVLLVFSAIVFPIAANSSNGPIRTEKFSLLSGYDTCFVRRILVTYPLGISISIKLILLPAIVVKYIQSISI